MAPARDVVVVRVVDANSDVLDWVQVGTALAQAIAAALTVFFAWRAIKAAGDARRDETERFERERQEAAARHEEHSQRLEQQRREEVEDRVIRETRLRQEDLERRLERVLDVLVDFAELRADLLGGSNEALTRVRVARQKLRVAVAATGIPNELPACQMLATRHDALNDAALEAAIAEVEQPLRVLGEASRLPWLRDAGGGHSPAGA